MLLGNLSHDVLAWIGGVAMSIIGLYISHKSKAIPIKITFGSGKANMSEEQGSKQFVTLGMLKENCIDRQIHLDKKLDERQVRLDSRLDEIVTAQKEFKNLLSEFALRFEGRISKIEGQIQARIGGIGGSNGF